MESKPFVTSPFLRYFPVRWRINSGTDPFFSLTHTHGMRTHLLFHHLADEVNRDRDELDKVLISYEITGRFYPIFTVSDFHGATYAFDDSGLSNLRGDLAERLARRVMKRFLQGFDGGFGRLGGLFDKRFNPKSRQNYVVANSENYVLKIGRYPNMILLKKTGKGAWGYQHITDLDGLFDYRYSHKRHLIILESKTGRIDLSAGVLYEKLFMPLKSLFPEANFTYALFADKRFLLDGRHPEYRALQETPVRIFEKLRARGIPSLFFEFNESEKDFESMCRHIFTSYRTYHRQGVTLKGRTVIGDSRIVIFGEGNNRDPYMELERDPASGLFRVTRSPTGVSGSTPGPAVVQ